MSLPSLLQLPSEAAYKQYFNEHYCNKCPITTWDGLPVYFFQDMFSHAFYKRSSKSWKAQKSTLDIARCERLPWISFILEDSSIISLQGYDKERNCYDCSRRVSYLAADNYVVVIRETGIDKWSFVTAYIVDNASTAAKLGNSPIWVKK